MTRSGGHRIRSVVRWVAALALLVAAGFVAYANYSASNGGGSTLLRIAGLTALLVGVAAVVLFDTEMIRNRRAHAAERAALAKSYAETYAAHARLTAVVAESAKAAKAAKAVLITDAIPSRAAAGATLSDDLSSMSARSTSSLPATLQKSDLLAAAEAKAGLVSRLDAPAGKSDAPELWEHLGEAPTVVDLIAWEERSRREEPASAKAADPVTDQVRDKTTDAVSDKITDAVRDKTSGAVRDEVVKSEVLQVTDKVTKVGDAVSDRITDTISDAKTA